MDIDGFQSESSCLIDRPMHIAITTLPGYSTREKKLLARKLKSTTALLLDIAPVTVSVSVKDLPMKEWCEFIRTLPDNEIIIPETIVDCESCDC